MGTPKEDPVEKAARERERKIAGVERNDATQKSAAGLTSDLMAVYGLRNLSMFGKAK